MDVLNIFNSSDKQIITKIPKTSLTTAQRLLFNGFDEIGGDITKYQDTVTWFENCGSQNEAIVLSVVLLDKPVTWLFAGMKNEQKNIYSETLDKINVKLVELNEDETSDTRKDRITVEIETMAEACEYMEEVGGLLTYCGEKKTMMNEVLCRSLALYSDVEIESFKNDQLTKMATVRRWWKGAFKLVNVTRMKRLALMYMEMCPKKYLNQQAAKWVNKHNGIPSKANRFGSNVKTEEIIKLDIKEFMEDKSHWKKYRSVFARTFTDRALIGLKHKSSEIQLDFIRKMGYAKTIQMKEMDDEEDEDESSVNSKAAGGGNDDTDVAGGVPVPKAGADEESKLKDVAVYAKAKADAIKKKLEEKKKNEKKNFRN